MHPIFDGREIVGHARNKRHAEQVIRRLITIPKNFRLVVTERSELLREIYNSDAGFIYSIVY
jgi:hypothetical protein